jgi:anti-sigma B factor antagonist
MPQKHEFSQLVVQPLPVAGVLVRFRTRKVTSEKTVRQINEELRLLIAPERLIVLDLSNVESLNSAAIAVLLRTLKDLKHRAGNLSLCGLRQGIEELFRITKLNLKFDIYPDLETALGEGPAGP